MLVVSRHTVYSMQAGLLNEGFKACWFTTLMKDSRHASLLP